MLISYSIKNANNLDVKRMTLSNQLTKNIEDNKYNELNIFSNDSTINEFSICKELEMFQLKTDDNY